MKLRAIVLLTLLAAMCGGRTERSLAPETLYHEGRIALWHGDFDKAESIAARGAREFAQRAEWRELYSILRAETMARRGGKEEVLALLDATPVSGNAEAAVRRRMARGYAYANGYDNARLLDMAAAEYLAAAAMAARSSPALRGEIAVLSITPPFRKQDWDRAEQFARQAFELGRAAKDSFIAANALGMLGTIEMNRGEFQQALKHLDEADGLARSIGAHTTESTIAGNTGWCYMQLGDTDEALRRYREALDDAVPRTQPTWLTNLSYVYLARQQFDSALRYSEAAVAAAARSDQKAKLASALANLALIYVELGRAEDAAHANAEATELRRQYDDKARPLLPYLRLTDARIAAATGSAEAAVKTLEQIIAKAGQDAELKWQAQAAAAEAYKNLGRLGDAARMYEAALDTGDNARARQLDDSYLFAFESNLIRFYDEYIELLRGQGRVADALRVAERSRARTLRLGIGLLEQGKGEARFAPSDIARAHGATILSYWLAPRRSLLWVVTPRGVDVKVLPPAAKIEREIDDYRAELQSHRHAVSSARGARLYAMLVAPAAITPTSRVIVVPDGRLNAINLETLIAPSPRPHYWIEDVTVSYTPSLQLLAGTRPWRGARDARLLVFGNVPAEAEFPALARAGEEITRVASHFNAACSTVVTGTAATPTAYAAMKPRQFEFLHFAAHGTANVRSPLDSAVILAPDKGGFRLFGRAIVKEPLAAQLVTVSSCNSAGQRSYAGEGMVGLAWAFLRAGAHRVVAAQWNVSDAATPLLMDRMYGALGRGLEPAAALREAKLALLRSGTVYRQPLYWAPFVVYGAM